MQIQQSKRVIAEAMHGAIVSDCFGIPWVGYSAYDYINSDKWNDWLSVLDHEVSLCQVNSLYRGYSELSFSNKFKQEVKHLLKSLGVWQKNWSPGIPRKSRKLTKVMISSQIKAIIENENFYCSKTELIDQQMLELKDKIRELKVKNG